MKIIWVVNITVQDAAEVLQEKNVGRIPWMEHMFYLIKEDVEIIVSCPVSNGKTLRKGEKDGIRYYGIPRKCWRGDKYEKKAKNFHKEIFMAERPDVIHIWGTEFPNTLSAVEAAEEAGYLQNTVISIQGLVSFICRHFMNGVPQWLQFLMVPKNFVRGYNLRLTQKSFRKRGRYEVEAIRKVNNVIGRTGWDKACTGQIHPGVQYYHNDETLREIFYEDIWQQEKCAPYTIFSSQGGGPLKGIHHILAAVNVLKVQYPDIHLYVTGRDVLGKLTLHKTLSFDSYDWYIRRFIKKYHLEDQVTFLGALDAEQMKAQYLSANVFVLSSSIENSPNSLGEAMLLGVPSVAADVGGVSSMVNRDEVYLYPCDEPYMLVYYIGKIFDDPDVAGQMAKRAREHALLTHDAEKNMQGLLAIYEDLKEGNHEDKWEQPQMRTEKF